jgi:ABC-type molybdate transport system substrate-binding protein
VRHSKFGRPSVSGHKRPFASVEPHASFTFTNRHSPEQHPSGAAVEALARGEADLVLIGVTPILQVPAVTLAGRLPTELQTYIAFTGSIGTAAKEPQAARTLLNLLTSPEGIALFKAQGFEPAVGP